MSDDDYQEIAVPSGMLAEVVTYLERRTPPADPPPDGPWRLERRERPDLDWYLDLYRTVGAEWLWYSRLATPRDKLARILADPATHVFALTRDGADVGIGELSLAVPRELEISFFGVVAKEIGAGAGKWLMAALLAAGWRPDTRRAWLHTCTLDHPNALPFYQRQGFRAYKRSVGLYPDPRLAGALGQDASLRVPIIAPDAGGDAG